MLRNLSAPSKFVARVLSAVSWALPCWIALAGGLLAVQASDVSPSPPRFLAALDLAGQVHHLGAGQGYRALVLVFLGTECPIAREYIPELNRLADSWDDQGVEFYGVISDPSCTRAAAAKYQQAFAIQFPLLFDASRELAATLGATHMPHAFVLDAQAQIVYQGRIDDMYAALGRKRPEPSTHELADAVAALLDGRTVAVSQTTPVGCPLPAVNSTEALSAVTYSRHIAPIVQAHCVECHRPGEVAPFSLLSYEDVAKRADFLSQVTRQRLMPPWKAEIGFGHFLGERYLSDTEIQLFEAWAKAGAPEGDSEDLPPAPQFATGWRLGEPDLVVKVETPCTVPASGPDVFQHFILPLDLPADKTVVGFEFRPGNPAVVHHAILMLDRMGVGRTKDAETPEPGYTTSGSIGIPASGILGVWTPGMTPRFLPSGIGMPIHQGSDLVVQLHLHPSGKEETDQSSIALYFADTPTDRTISAVPLVIGTLLLDIPAGANGHTVTSSVTLPTGVTLISLLPHMHLVGKEMKLDATLPDGTVQPLVWIKDWNFYWQDNYVYHEPVRLPRGTRLELVSRYDNSAENPQNPSSPPQRVLFGNDSTDEMCFGIFQVVADKPGEERKLMMALAQGFLKEWNNAKIDPEARAQIMEEAGKLFGTGGGRGGSFESLFGGRGRGERRGGNRAEPSSTN